LINITDTRNQYLQRNGGYFVNTAMANGIASSTEESPSSLFALNANAVAYVPHVYAPDLVPAYAPTVPYSGVSSYPPQPAHPPPHTQALPLATLLMDLLVPESDTAVSFKDGECVTEQAVEMINEVVQQVDPNALPSLDSRTTVMLRNVPYHEGQNGVLKLLEEKGFSGKFDFFYAPLDFNSGNNLGYAFISLRSPQIVTQFHDAMDGLRVSKEVWQQKELRVCWARVQGLAQNVEHYRNSPVNDMPEQFRPMIFDVDGEALVFPRPDANPGNGQGTNITSSISNSNTHHRRSNSYSNNNGSPSNDYSGGNGYNYGSGKYSNGRQQPQQRRNSGFGKGHGKGAFASTVPSN
jgi:hypothetical protein